MIIKITDQEYIAIARRRCDDELEVDDISPKVSRSVDGDGAWVAAWIWVAAADVT